MRMRTIAVTNSGIAVSERPVSVITRSVRRAAAQAGDDAAEDAERHDDARTRRRASLSEFDERRAEQVADRHLVLERRAEVAVQRSVVIQSQYCVDQRPVDAELVVAARRRRCWLAKLPEDVAADVARQQLRRGEHDHAEQEQRDEREAEAFEQEASDERPPSTSGRPPRGARRPGRRDRAAFSRATSWLGTTCPAASAL